MYLLFRHVLPRFSALSFAVSILVCKHSPVEKFVKLFYSDWSLLWWTCAIATSTIKTLAFLRVTEDVEV